MYRVGCASRALCVGVPRDTTVRARDSRHRVREIQRKLDDISSCAESPTRGKSRAHGRFPQTRTRAGVEILLAQKRIGGSVVVLIGTSLASIRHMTTANLTPSDIRLRDAVMRQLAWDPEVDASAVGVSATEGTVTLTGYIDTYAGKLAAERAAKRVVGVRAVANDIDVRLRLERTDTDIAQDSARALRLLSTIPDGVQAAVHNGRVTLTGTVHWLFQKESAEQAVRHIRGVRNVISYVNVAPGSVSSRRPPSNRQSTA